MHVHKTHICIEANLSCCTLYNTGAHYQHKQTRVCCRVCVCRKFWLPVAMHMSTLRQVKSPKLSAKGQKAGRTMKELPLQGCLTYINAL